MQEGDGNDEIIKDKDAQNTTAETQRSKTKYAIYSTHNPVSLSLLRIKEISNKKRKKYIMFRTTLKLKTYVIPRNSHSNETAKKQELHKIAFLCIHSGRLTV